MAFHRRYDSFGGDTTPIVPTWDGRNGAQGLEAYTQEARMNATGIEKAEIRIDWAKALEYSARRSQAGSARLGSGRIAQIEGLTMLLGKLADKLPETALKSAPSSL